MASGSRWAAAPGAPILLAVDAAAATLGSPVYTLGVIGAFVVGHIAVLLGAASAGTLRARHKASSPRWAWLDRVVGALFLSAAAYYLFRVFSGTATTILPLEPGGLIP